MKKLILLLFIIVLGSCQKMSNGYIIDKWYEPEETNFFMMPIVHSNGKTTSMMLIPMYLHDGEDFCIKVKGIGVRGDTIIRTYYLEKGQFDTLDIGRFICIDGACDEDQNNIEGRK